MRQNFIYFIAIIFVLEFYIFNALRSIITNPLLRWIYVSITALIYLLIIYASFNLNQSNNSTARVQLVVTLFLAILLPKVLTAAVFFIDDIVRIFQLAFSYFTNKEQAHFPARRTFLTYLGLGLAGVFAMTFLYGVAIGKYKHKVRTVTLKLKNLPSELKGIKIVQLSDFHAGSFLNPDRLRETFEKVNSLNPDVVVFTGDMVNNTADEFLPFKNHFSSLKAKYGKFAVLGNHDYGHYYQWESKAEEENNLNSLIENIEDTGFKMLRNESHSITLGENKLHIIGVENWGEKPFPQYGDIDKASKNIPANEIKVLLSHDPTYFDQKIKNHPANIQLTLSGHTHGMQFGIDLKNLKWSPVQYRYKKWIDIYEEKNRFLYVNRGFGIIGYPGRVGIDPEITLIELQQG